MNTSEKILEKLFLNLKKALNIDLKNFRWVYLFFGVGGLADFFNQIYVANTYEGVQTPLNIPLPFLIVLEFIFSLLMFVNFFAITRGFAWSKELSFYLNLLLIVLILAIALNTFAIKSYLNSAILVVVAIGLGVSTYNFKVKNG